MLLLDFINVGNGDSILIREEENGRRKFAMLVDCGHDCLVRDDHPDPLDTRSQRIYAGDFLKQLGIDRLDLLLLTGCCPPISRRRAAAPWIPTGTTASPKPPGTPYAAWISMPRPSGTIRAR